MKIIFFADAGVEHTLRWTKFFAELGHEVHLISWNLRGGSGQYHNDDFAQDFLPVQLHLLNEPISSGVVGRMLRMMRLGWRVRELVKKIKPDVIHSHSLGAYSWITLILRGAKTIITPWGTDVLVDMRNSFLNRTISLLTLWKASLITVDGYHIRDIFRHYGIDYDKIKMVFFGVDVKKFSRSKRVRTNIRAKSGFGNDDIVVISTRTLNPIHDVFTTLRSVSLVGKENRRIRYIIGSDGVQRAELEKFIADNNLDEVVYFPGYFTIDEMVEYLAGADIYVSSSIADAGLAASTAEAMAMELPVIVTDNSDNRIWVEGAGLLFNDGDHVGLATAILELSNDSAMRQEMGQHGRQIIADKNNYEIEMEKMNRIYMEVQSK